MPLTRSQITAQVAALITDPLTNQNTAFRVRAALDLLTQNMVNTEDDSVTPIPHDLDASSAPTNTDDNTGGWVPFSHWIVNNTDVYICKDNTTNNAVWIKVNQTVASQSDFIALSIGSGSVTYNTNVVGLLAKITLNQNVTTFTHTNSSPGHIGYIHILQDPTGGRTFVRPSNVIGSWNVDSSADSSTLVLWVNVSGTIYYTTISDQDVVTKTLNPTSLDLTDKETQFSTYTQSVNETWERLVGTPPKKGASGSGKYVSTGSNTITLGSGFNEVKGTVSYMASNAGTYEIYFYYHQPTDEIQIFIPNAVENTADTTAPLLVSAEVGAIDATSLILTYNESLNTGSVPATSDFSVNDGASNPVTSVSITGNKVDLTLTNAVVGGATVTVSYTPGANPIEDAVGNGAAALTNEPVTNNVSDITGPQFVSAEVGNVDETSLIITFNEALDTGSVPATTDFSVNDGAANAVTNVAVVGSTVDLTLTNAIELADTVIVSYTPGANPIQDLVGNDAGSLTNQAVTNNVVFDVLAFFEGVYEADSSGQFTFHSGVNIATWLNKSTHASALNDLNVTAEANSPTYDSGNSEVDFNGSSQTFDLYTDAGFAVRTLAIRLNGYIDLSTRNSIGEPYLVASESNKTLCWGPNTGLYDDETIGTGGANDKVAIDDTPNTTPTYNTIIFDVENGVQTLIYLNGTLGNIISSPNAPTGIQMSFQLGYAAGFDEWFTGSVKGVYIGSQVLSASERSALETRMSSL